MRLTPCLLLFFAVARADDPFPAASRTFESALAELAETGARSRVLPALEQLAALKDLRAIEPIVQALRSTIAMERATRERNGELQRMGAAAMDRVVSLREELKMLSKRARAGATDVGQQIHEREEEMKRQTATFERIRVETERLDRRTAFLVELRNRLAEAAGSVLAASGQSESLDAGLNKLRRSLDVARAEEALYLVYILRDSGLVEAAPHLIDILNHPRASRGTVRAAASALARLKTKPGAKALLELWERDPDGIGVHVAHVMSLAAGQRLATPDEARAWAATLP